MKNELDLDQTTLKAVVFNLMSAMRRENWFDWSATEAQTWLENQALSRNYTPKQATAIALLTMKNFVGA